MLAPRGRGRGAFNQLSRPHDIFRQRKQNTSRPPSMHVDDFLAAEFKEVSIPVGLALPKRPLKGGGGAKPPTRGLFTGGTRGRGFQSHTRFFTPPAPKSALLASMSISQYYNTYMELAVATAIRNQTLHLFLLKVIILVVRVGGAPHGVLQ